MVTTEIECVCSNCRKVFICKKECRNGLEAEKFRAYALKHRNICPSCYSAEQQRQAQNRAVALDLPIIIGKTDKQVAFAFSLRDRYISSHEESIHYAMKQMEKINPTQIPAAARKHGVSEEKCVAEAFRRINLYIEFLCLTEASARTLIDALNNRKSTQK